jgi:hypothetical protein
MIIIDFLRACETEQMGGGSWSSPIERCLWQTWPPSALTGDRHGIGKHGGAELGSTDTLNIPTRLTITTVLY